MSNALMRSGQTLVLAGRCASPKLSAVLLVTPQIIAPEAATDLRGVDRQHADATVPASKVR